ncbi:MAG: hypothetical protein ABR964_01525 [Tepidisphaeraceae bacterium]|jgi:hypothetical protein
MNRVSPAWMLVLCVVFCGCASHQATATRPASAGMVGYTPPKGGFTTQYPSAWHPGTGKDTLNLAPAKDDSGGKRRLSIDVPDIPFHLPGMMTMGAVQKGFTDDLQKRFQGLHIDSVSDQAMAGARAKRIKATGKEGGTPMVIDAVVAMNHEQVYIISSESDQAGAKAGSAAVDAIVTAWQWN